MNEKFMTLIAKEAVRSPIVTTEIAKQLRTNTGLINEIASNLDAEIIGKELSNRLLETINTNRGHPGFMNEIAWTTITSILKRANEIAAQTVAAQMVKDMETA